MAVTSRASSEDLASVNCGCRHRISPAARLNLPPARLYDLEVWSKPSPARATWPRVAHPDLARLCLLESVSATPTIAIGFREAVLACVPALARGRSELADPDSLLPETESSIIGGDTSKLPDLADFTLAPYLGADRALELAAEARAS
jgi:hypothetical protein